MIISLPLTTLTPPVTNPCPICFGDQRNGRHAAYGNVWSDVPEGWIRVHHMACDGGSRAAILAPPA